MKKFKKRILIDLDGVLNTYNGIYNPDVVPPPAEGAEDFLEELSKEYELVLFSSREQDKVKNWSKEYGLDKYFSETTNVKKCAYLIIDDRCICFKGCFKELTKQVKEFRRISK